MIRQSAFAGVAIAVVIAYVFMELAFRMISAIERRNRNKP